MKRTNIAESKDLFLVDRLTTVLRKRGPVSGLSADSAASFIKLGSLVELEPGEALMREDEDALPEVYLLVDGALAVQSKSGIVARLDKPGDVIGEVAVLLSSKRTADVVADVTTRVVAIPAKVLKMPQYGEVASGVSGAMIRDDWVQY